MGLISEVVVQSNTSRLLLTLKDQGTFFVPWKHYFPTGFISPDERDMLLAAFEDYQPRAFNRIPRFNVVQILAPTNFAKIPKSEEQQALFDKYFFTGHYTKQAHWRFSPQWREVQVDEKLEEILLRKEFEDKRFRENKAKGEGLRSDFNAYVSERFPGSLVEINKKTNSLDVILSSLNLRPLRHISSESILRSGLYICDIEKPLFNTPEEEVSWFASVVCKNEVVVQKIVRSLRELATEKIQNADGSFSDWNYLKNISENELVSAVVREINTNGILAVIAYNAPYDLENTREAGDFLIGERESDPKVQVAQSFFRKDIVRGKLVIDPLRLARTRFDYMPNRKLELVLQEAHGVEIAKELNYSQLAELERVAKTNDRTHAGHTVEMMLVKEEQRFPGRKPKHLAAGINARYVAADVDHLNDMTFSPWVKESLEDAVWMAETYGIELSRLLHSTNSINDAQERQFFDMVGTFIDFTLHKKAASFVQAAQRATQYAWKAIDNKLAEHSTLGLHENVYKAYLPIGLWLAPHVAGINPKNSQQRFPDVMKLVNYAQQHKANKHRYYALLQYLESFSSYITVDYGLAAKARDDFNKLLKSKELLPEHFTAYHLMWQHQDSPLAMKLAEHRVPPGTFEAFSRRYKQILHTDSTKKDERQSWAEFHLERGTLTKEGLKKYPDAAADFASTYQFTSESLADLFKLAAQERQRSFKTPTQQKLSEKHITDWFVDKHKLAVKDVQELLNANRKQERLAKRVAGQYNSPLEAIDETFRRSIQGITDYCETHGLAIIHAQGSYVYLVGDESAMRNPDAPVIRIDTLKRAYVAINPADSRSRERDDVKHKVYYRKHNYFEGIKVTDRPSHAFTLYEMRCYAPLLERILDNDIDGAIEHAKDVLGTLKSMVDEKTAERKHIAETMGKEHADTESYEHLLTIPKEEFLWHSKSSDRYRGWERGEKVHFVTSEERVPEGAGLKLDSAGRRYFEESIPRSKNVRSVYVMPVSQFQPDVAAFYRVVKDKMADLLAPLLGVVGSAEFVHSLKEPKQFRASIQS